MAFVILSAVLHLRKEKSNLKVLNNLLDLFYFYSPAL